MATSATSPRRRAPARARGFASGLRAAGIFAAALFVGQAVPRVAHADDVVITEEARTHFAAGVALLKDPRGPRYEDAYREFKAAYAASPSYKILGNLGLCAMQIERDNEAINAYESYLKLAGPELTPDELEQVKRDLLTLRAGVVAIAVSSDPPGAHITDVRVPVQGSEIRNSYGQLLKPLVLGLRRGHHIITAKLEGYQDQHWELDTADTNQASHVFKMVKPLPVPTAAVPERAAPRMIEERPVPISAYATGGAAIGLAIAGTAFGVASVVHHQGYDTNNTGASPSQVSAEQSSRTTGIALNATTDACFASAIVLGGVAAYFLFTRPTVTHPAESASSSAAVPRIAVAPSWTPAGPGAAMRVTF